MISANSENGSDSTSVILLEKCLKTHVLKMFMKHTDVILVCGVSFSLVWVYGNEFSVCS